MPIKIDYTGDPREFLDATDKATDALDKTADALDDVADAGKTTGSSTADGLSDVADAADDAAGATDELGDATERSSAKGSSFADSFKSGLLGIAGVAGGVAGIVTTVLGKAVDFVTSQINDQITASAQLKQSLIDAYVKAGEAGDRYLDKALIVANANDIIADSAKRAKAEQEAAAIGIDTSTVIAAQAGDYEALKVVIEAAHRAEDDRLAAANDGSKSSTASKLQDVQALERIIKRNEDLLEVHKEGQEAAQLAIQVSKDIEASELGRIDRTSSADQARWEALADNVAKLDGTKVEIQTTFSIDKDPVEKYLADLRARHIPIVADIVDRYGRRVD